MVVGKVQKWGNSQGLRLPRTILELAEIAVGDEVEVEVHDRQITLKKSSSAKYQIADLVARIPDDYKSAEVDFGPPMGKEAW